MHYKRKLCTDIQPETLKPDEYVTNSSLANILILYPQKTLENEMFSGVWCFQGE